MESFSHFFDNNIANQVMGKRFGGLNLDKATEKVKDLLAQGGDLVVKVADTCGILPKEEHVRDYFLKQIQAHGVNEACQALSSNPRLFGSVWKKINSRNWEAFCVPSDHHANLTPYEPLIAKAKESKELYRAIQAVAEYSFPKLYLLRVIALGVTAANEDWISRIKINTFRTFFLRLALLGQNYDKYINYYVILTSEKDIWDEMKYNDDSKMDFLVESVVNIASTQLSGYFESQFEELLASTYRNLRGR